MKHIFRKLAALLLALLLLPGLTACNDLSEALSTAEDIYSAAANLYGAAEDSAFPIAEEGIEGSTTSLPAPPAEAPSASEETALPETVPEESASPIDANGSYTTKDDVALYLHTYGKLPKNFVTKSAARELGWDGGSLEPYFPGCCIGGDSFGNREGLLPRASGRTYTECDIDTLGGSSRGAKRIVFSNDGLIYYTDDHYESFTLLYGEE